MIIQSYNGYELVKAQSNTSEDYFNRSEVTYTHNGEEKTLHVLYIRYFEEQLAQFTPFTGNPVFQVGERDILFREMLALACLLKNPEFANRKRIYMNTQEELSVYMDEENIEKTKQAIEKINNGGSVEIKLDIKTA
ncbi:hypothetical protein ACFDTO_16345 [Microbacteriaceae bacterium 4G12]